jgi:sugar phosphate isomerase/epimerase
MMDSISRRRFLQATAVGAGSLASLGGGAFDLMADPLNMPIGLQLYTVGPDMAKDFDGTLKQIAAIGYKSLELANLASVKEKNPVELRKQVDGLGMHCASGHVVQTAKDEAGLDTTIDYCKTLGLDYMVCAAFNLGALSGAPPPAPPAPGAAPGAGRGRGPQPDLTLDDYKRVADEFNRIGEKIDKVGMKFAYHNHAMEFVDYNGATGFDYLLAQTDPKLVHYELDCDWAVYAGQDPVALMKKYPNRIKMLHIKDEQPGFPATTGRGGAPTTEIGKGKIDWKQIFVEAKKIKIDHYFVEQEPPFSEMPPLQAIKVSYDYLHSLHVSRGSD